MAIIERIVTVYNDKGSKQALKDLNKLEQNFKDAGKKIAKAFGVAALAAGALAVKLGKDGVEAAIADQKSQALLANALRNTTGATDSAIAGVEDYIATQQRLVSVTDDELRPSLTTLLNATQDITEAQALQSLALDISAGAQKDLQSVSLALAKAVGGNIGALTKLGVPLSEDIKKSKDLNAALDELGKTFAGAASTRAQTFEGRMQGIQIAFSEALETLGFAFLPVLEDLVVVFQTQVIPAFEKFIAQNKDELAGALGDIIEFLIKATKGLGSMFKTISDNLTTFKIFTALIVGTFVGTKVAAGIGAIIAALKLLTGVFKKQAVAGTAAGTATAFATGGTSAFAAAAGITAFTAAVGGTLLVLNKMTNSLDDNTEAIQKNSQVVQGHLADLGRISQATAAANIKNKALSVTTSNLNKKTKEQLATEKALAALRKLGVVPTTEKDPIQLEAARLLLLKQANLEETRKVAALIANAEAQMKVNEEAQRYSDLLQALSDQTISSEEVSVLASKWNLTKAQVLEYIAKLFAANTTELDDSAILKLLQAWGLTKAEAQKYVDFARALKDEKIDDSEVKALMDKWKLTRNEVFKYAEDIKSLNALSVTLSPSITITDDFSRALQALNTYIGGLANSLAGLNVDFSDSGNRAATGWANATVALQTYLRELYNSQNPNTPSTDPIDPQFPWPDPNIRPFAMGGIVKKATIGLVGEAGPEAIIPLSKMPEVFEPSGGGMNVYVTVQGSVISEGDLIEQVRQGLLDIQVDGGAVLVNSRTL